MKCPNRSSWVSPHCPRNLKVKLGCHHSLASWDSEAWKCWRILSWMTFFQANCFLDPPKKIFCLAMGIPWFSPILGLKLWQKLARLLSVNTILNHPIVSMNHHVYHVCLGCYHCLSVNSDPSLLQIPTATLATLLALMVAGSPSDPPCLSNRSNSNIQLVFFSVSIPSIPGLTVWNSRLFKTCCL